MDIEQMLFELSRAQGVSGEDGALSVAERLLKDIAPTVRDDMGGISCCFGSGSHKIMLDAHIDEIGMIVTAIEGGFLRVGKMGGIDTRTVINQRVTVHGTQPVTGVFASLPPHLKKDDKSAPELDGLAIDCGMSGERLNKLVRVGDRVSFCVEPRRLTGTKVTGKSLDNRAGVAAVIDAARRIKAARANGCTVIVSLSAQEETALRGAKISAYQFDPDEAIVVDVSFGDGAGLKNTECGKLGGGAMIGVSPVLDRSMTDRLESIAEEKGIKHQTEVMGGSTGTNADVISVSRGGVRTALISIPLRNMHTCCEVVDINDIKAVSDMITAYAGGFENA